MPTGGPGQLPGQRPHLSHHFHELMHYEQQFRPQKAFLKAEKSKRERGSYTEAADTRGAHPWPGERGVCGDPEGLSPTSWADITEGQTGQGGPFRSRRSGMCSCSRPGKEGKAAGVPRASHDNEPVTRLRKMPQGSSAAQDTGCGPERRGGLWRGGHAEMLPEGPAA